MTGRRRYAASSASLSNLERGRSALPACGERVRVRGKVANERLCVLLSKRDVREQKKPPGGGLSMMTG